jgi:hypothetical protein
MTEEISDEDEFEYEEDISYRGQVENKYETEESKFIQGEIQLVTRKIEREKIKLRIADERLEAKKKLYNQLQGKPVQKTDEEKEREHEKKLKANLSHKLETISKPRSVNKTEEFRLTQRKQFSKINKQESELETLTKTINETNLKIEDLKFEIANLRKRKLAHEKKLEDLILENEAIVENIGELKKTNEKEMKQINNRKKKLSKTKEAGAIQNREFQEERNGLEDQYHKIIEANIQRERERIKEQAKKRQMIGIMAKQVMRKNDKNYNKDEDSIEEQIKKLKSEEISDRIPILDLIIEKWKNINKTKKNMLIKYNKNSVVLKKSFDIIMKFLGVEDYDELPIIYKKTEEQMADVQMHICELQNEKHKKEETKELLLEQIKILNKNKIETTTNKSAFGDLKKNNIKKLQEQIDRMQNEIKEKREFFCKLQPMTDRFLERLNNTYVGDYIPNKVRSLHLKYNEHNIQGAFDNISNYFKLISEMENSFKGKATTENIINTNRILDSLGAEFRTTLENFKFDGYLTQNLLKPEGKGKDKNKESKNIETDYFRTIEKLSENIVNLAQSGNLTNSTKFSKIKSKET